MIALGPNANDIEERLKFAKQARRLRNKNWPDAEIAEKLLGGRRYTRGVAKLVSLSYVAALQGTLEGHVE